MAVIRNKLCIEIAPNVQEICAVVSAVAAFYPGEEARILEGVKKAMEVRLEELKISKEEHFGAEVTPKSE